MGVALEIKNIYKSFGNLKALDDISFSAEERSLTILMGPNGSGKTTLINVVSGLYKPDSGSISFFKKDITGMAPHKIYKLGLARTFQIPALFPQLTVLENLMVARKYNPGESFSGSLLKRNWLATEENTAEHAFEVLGMVGLSHMWDKNSSVLSGGQLKLLEIGRALMSEATMMLLDEPISGVNPTLAHQIFSTLVKIRDNYGVTFLIIEHRLDIALRYVDAVVAMAYGKFLISGRPEEVTSDVRVIDAYLGG